MKLFIWFSLFLVSHGKLSEDNIINELCFKPDAGPSCQKLKTFYWNKELKRCVETKYLMEPCGFFYKKNTCTEICSKESWTLYNLENYVRTLH
ncbi:uncharacterized protein LOC108045849 [Drosophila rhopaloa]|uniref:Uncharacterized protein LOC108045849 n=1 Tax=Drosophila rhopaloa TaxID=1041015 RepID=A0A6P4EVL8_DRORH|nr:uncharacterized protein LOC108045849 [Drosophila rhopaloa]